MADKYVLYVTNEGDRWDQISQAHYGTPYEYERIIAANPTIPIRASLPAGLRIAVPVISRTASQASSLPPWKR